MFQNLRPFGVTVPKMCVRITTSALLLTGSAILLGCSSSERQTSPTADNAVATPQAAPPSADAGSASGMKAFIDKETGEMRAPTDAERAAMERNDAALKSTEEPQQTESKLSGRRGTAITVEGRPQTPMQACTNADGSVTIDHDCQPAKEPQPNK